VIVVVVTVAVAVFCHTLNTVSSVVWNTHGTEFSKLLSWYSSRLDTRIHLLYLLRSLLSLYSLFTISFDPYWIPTYLIVLFFKLLMIGMWKVSKQVMVSLLAVLNISEWLWRWYVTPVIAGCAHLAHHVVYRTDRMFASPA
jgi:ABC-type protease/lipase transport system fused ATPase/permease subunit